MEGIVQALLFTVLKAVLIILVNVIDILSGWSILHGSKKERLQSEEYENSAQLVKVWSRGRRSMFTTHSDWNFLWTHSHYTHPNVILEDKNAFISAAQ